MHVRSVMLLIGVEWGWGWGGGSCTWMWQHEGQIVMTDFTLGNLKAITIINVNPLKRSAYTNHVQAIIMGVCMFGLFYEDKWRQTCGSVHFGASAVQTCVALLTLQVAVSMKHKGSLHMLLSCHASHCAECGNEEY